jgi:hypothetical protein
VPTPRAENLHAAVGGGFKERVLSDRAGGDDRDGEVGIEGAHVDDVAGVDGFVVAHADGRAGGIARRDAVCRAAALHEEVAFGDGAVSFESDALAGQMLTLRNICEGHQFGVLSSEF